jgi:cell division protein ZipA
MEPLRWVLLLAGIVLILLVFVLSRGWYPQWLRPNYWRKSQTSSTGAADSGSAGDDDNDNEPPLLVNRKPEKAAAPALKAESKVVAVRIMPAPGSAFPADELILTLREAGLRHGQLGIFHCHADDDEERIRYSVASLIEPGSFDLSKLKDSEYKGVSMFAILPAPEDGLQLFDDMISKAREIAKAVEGTLADEQGGTFSLQRERYMREDLIEYLRRDGISREPFEQSAAE